MKKIRIVKCDETAHWNMSEFGAHSNGKVISVYFYDSESVTHYCSPQKLLYLHHVDTSFEPADLSIELSEEEREKIDEVISLGMRYDDGSDYYDYSLIDAQKGKEIEFAEDLTVDEIMEELHANCGNYY